MTKKIFAMFLALLMVASVLPTSVFAANEHPDAGKHTANNCDCVVIAVTEPTCGSAGYTTYMCADCGEVFADNYVPATGVHSMVAGEGKAPTCGAAGYEAGKECEDCGYVEPGKTIAPVYKLGTTCEYKDLTPNIDCTTGGKKTWECVVCGHTKTETIKKAADHAWDFGKFTVKVEPTDTEDGIIVIPCSKCSATKEVTWFDAHSCAEARQWHVEIPMTCTTDGVIGHYECRVCGKLYEDAACTKAYRAGETTEFGGVIIPAKHDYEERDYACYEKEMECGECGETYILEAKHKFESVEGAQDQEASCIKPGYKYEQCSVCYLPNVETTPAKGHISHTVTVPATCGTYAYTYTFCLRKGCDGCLAGYTNTTSWTDKKGVEYNVGLSYLPADKLVVDEVLYNLGVFSAYIPGYIYPAYAGLTLEEVKDYKDEVVEGKYFVKLATGKYLGVEEIKEGENELAFYYPRIITTDEPVVAFSMNEELGTLTATLERGEYYLFYDLTESDEDKVIKVTSVADTDAYYLPLELSYTRATSVQLVKITVDTKGGYDAEKHNTVKEYLEEPTCEVEGIVHEYCVNHGCTYSTTVNVGKYNHFDLYVNLAPTQANVDMLVLAGFNVTLNTIYKPNSCTEAGWKYVKCAWCDEIQKVALPAHGHYFATWYNPLHNDGDHKTSSYDYWTCLYDCGTEKKINVEAWEGMNKTWDTKEEAILNHGHGELDYVVIDGKMIFKTPEGYFIKENDTNGYFGLYLRSDFSGRVAYKNPANYSLFGEVEDTTSLTGWISDLTHETLFRDGDCTTQGLYRYLCDGCNKYVYVKQWKYLTDKDGDRLTDSEGNEIYYKTGSHYVDPFTLTADVIYVKEVKDANNQVIIPERKISAGTRIDNENYMQKATCLEYGYLFTFKCACCDKVIGNSTLKTAAPIAKSGHKWVPNTSDVVEFNPCPNGVPYICGIEGCGATRDTAVDTINGNPCTDLLLEYYMCSCGEEHVRGVYGKFGHKYIVDSNLGDDATHELYGDKATADKKVDGHDFPEILTYTCAYCDMDPIYEVLPVVHENKDEEEFTDLCTDTVKDRHCVLCCKHADKGNKHDCYTCDESPKDGKLDCSCMIKKDHHWAVSSRMGSTCTMQPYTVQICADCGKQNVSLTTSFLVEGKDGVELEAVKKIVGEEEVVDHYVITNKADFAKKNADGDVTAYNIPYASIDFKGHMPAEVDYQKDKDGKIVMKDGEPVEIRYANYYYIEDYVHTSYEWILVKVPTIDVDTDDDGYAVYDEGDPADKWVLREIKSKPYTAKFEKYVAPTFAADGVLKTDCQICDDVCEQILPKKSGLGFEMSIANANGQSGLAFGSLIEVTVSVNALDAAIYGFEFDVTNTMGKDMIYVGYEIANENFNVTVTDPIKVAHKGAALKVAGFAVNNAEGKVQNIEITEKTALVKLYFRSVSKATGTYEFKFANTAATALKDGATKATATVANYTSAKATISGLMDFNGDKVASSADLYQAMTLITGEHASGKTYNVTVDLNKDGELTLEDLAIGYNYLVGNYDRIEMLMLGLSADEAEELAELMKEIPAFSCMNEACDYGSKYYFDVCPVCRTVQPEQKVEEPKPVEIKCVDTTCDYKSEVEFEYCRKCGAKQWESCVNCGVAVEAGYVFCDCGQRQFCKVAECEAKAEAQEDYCAEAVCPVCEKHGCEEEICPACNEHGCEEDICPACNEHGCEEDICPDCNEHGCLEDICPDCNKHDPDNCTCTPATTFTCACTVAEAHNGGSCANEVTTEGGKCDDCAYDHNT